MRGQVVQQWQVVISSMQRRPQTVSPFYYEHQSISFKLVFKKRPPLSTRQSCECQFSLQVPLYRVSMHTQVRRMAFEPKTVRPSALTVRPSTLAA